MCSDLSHTQESVRRFIEVAWVPLHWVRRKARTVRLSLPFSPPQGISAFFQTAGVFLQFFGQQGYSSNFPGQQGICVLLYTHTQTVSSRGIV
ncbi:hypothetical protein Taro_031965 [Colocasia esculenta]|uniref:Uncharacterized protein n=1 Tax=Colocasia esculenta TaxID=4460 RepID=A0A843W0G0_COLES|nr:hypothetical protein [Colocasia esculenta]